MIKKLIIYYSFVITLLMTLVAFFSANSFSELVSAVFFFPLTVYFSLMVLPAKKRSSSSHNKTRFPKANHPSATSKPISLSARHNFAFPTVSGSLKSSPNIQLIDEDLVNLDSGEDPIDVDVDIDRRKFIKLIGSAGISLFMMSLFTKKAQAAFFGSVPGPGSVTLKDPVTGQQISPAIRTPTDGYKIADLDDSTPAYYGFLNQDGNWFIMREDASGGYRYIQGTTSYASNWTNRASLSFDTFDNVF